MITGIAVTLLVLLLVWAFLPGPGYRGRHRDE